MPVSRKRTFAVMGARDQIYTERWNEDILKQILVLQDTPADTVTALRAAVKRMHGGQLQVAYKHS